MSNPIFCATAIKHGGNCVGPIRGRQLFNCFPYRDLTLLQCTCSAVHANYPFKIAIYKIPEYRSLFVYIYSDSVLQSIYVIAIIRSASVLYTHFLSLANCVPGQVISSLLQFATSICGATSDTVLTPAVAISLASLNLLVNGMSIALWIWTRKLD
jgi:hypothetical protein